MIKPFYWKFAPFLIFCFLVIFFWRGLSLNPHELPSVQIGKALPDFNLPRLETNGEFFTPNNLKNQVVLLNIWASWCMACTEEQVFLMQLAREGMPIYGINYKDNSQNARNWLAEWGNPYQMIGEDIKGRASMDLGVYGAPETFLIDKSGVIRYRHTGPLTAQVWKETFAPMIKNLEAT